MNALQLEDRAWIIKRAPRRNRSAPSTATVTIANALGVATPTKAAGAVRVGGQTGQQSSELRLSTEQASLPQTMPEDKLTKASAVPVLDEALAFAAMVSEALPVNHELDRRAEAALAKHAARRQRRKLSAK